MTQEIHQSRRDRSRRALFWAKLVGIALVLLTGAILRTQPDLRNALLDNGINTVVGLMGAETTQEPAAEEAPAAPSDPAPQTTAMPRSTVKVNRGTGISDKPRTQPSTEDIAHDLGQTLSTRKVGN